MSAHAHPSHETVEAVLLRDRGRCVRCGRYVAHGLRGLDFSIHHRRVKGMGGDRRPDTQRAGNLIVLCGHGTDGCHGLVHHRPRDAMDAGFLVPQLMDPRRVPVQHFLYGLVYLDHDGGWSETGVAA
jgi:hypothetical protein